MAESGSAQSSPRAADPQQSGGAPVGGVPVGGVPVGGGSPSGGGSPGGRARATLWRPGTATGIGSLPGSSAVEAARIVAGELPELPHLVELPDRGVGADLVGRTVGLLVDIFADVIPSGWRIVRRPGRDVRRSRDGMARDLDAAEQHFAGADAVKLQVCGPWTLAAGLELPSGQRALTDPGAVRDLADSLSEGVRQHVAEVRSRLPGAALAVQFDEPGLPAVLRGSLPTPSGFGTVSAVSADTAEILLTGIVEALPAGVGSLVHCCHPGVPLRLLRTAGFGALSLDLTAVGRDTTRWDMIGEAIDAGTVVLAGLVPARAPSGPPPSLADYAAPLLDIFHRLGFPRSGLAEVIPTPTCGLAGADPDWARTAMRLCRELGQALQDPPRSWSADS